MEVTLNIKSANVKRFVNLIVSISFAVFGIVSCYFMTYFDYVINNATDIVIKVISTLFFILFSIAIIFINIIFYVIKNDSDFGYYLASGFGIGAGIAVESCALLVYPMSALFFWPFALVPIIIFAINTTIWSFICKNTVKEDVSSLINKKNLPPLIISFVMSVGVCIALLVYLIMLGMSGDHYSFIPIIIVAPILILAIISFTLSAVKRKEFALLSLVVGLCIGLLWILEFNKFLDVFVFNTSVSFTVFTLGLVGFIVWLTYKIIDSIVMLNSNKNNTISIDVSSNK